MLPSEPRQLPQRLLHLLDGDHPLRVAEERMDHEVGFVLGPDARSDGRPEMFERPAGDRPRLLRPREAHLRLRPVEREVPPLVLDDRLEELDQDGVLGLRDDPVVPRQRAELVHGAPGHVHGDEITEQRRPEQRPHVGDVSLRPELPPDPLVPVDAGGERVVSRDVFEGGMQSIPRLSEEAAERLPVPELLVAPTRQERGDLRDRTRRGSRGGRGGTRRCGSRCPSCR